jgi:hypothetical protein
MVKVTKQNFKKYVKDLKAKNVTVCTTMGKTIPAKDAKFKLIKGSDKKYHVVATKKGTYFVVK